MGLVRDTSRAMRLNLRALPNDSRYSSTRAVRSSSAQYCSRSLADTSARLPMAANDDAPSPASPMRSSRAPPIVPDSDSSATGPRRGLGVANVACRRTSGSVLITPRQLGPSRRIPNRRAAPQRGRRQRRALGTRLGEARRR